VIAVDAYRDRFVAVFGLGGSGLSAARALAAGGARVRAWDDGQARRAEIEAEIEAEIDAETNGGIALAEPSPEAWADVAALVLSPGVPLTHPEPHAAVRLAGRLGIEVLGDVELFARTGPTARLVAITGTNGKSTTTALLGHLLARAGKRVQIGANLGRPVLDLEPLGADGVYVLELSSYQIDLTRSLRPGVACGQRGEGLEHAVDGLGNLWRTDAVAGDVGGDDIDGHPQDVEPGYFLGTVPGHWPGHRPVSPWSFWSP